MNPILSLQAFFFEPKDDVPTKPHAAIEFRLQPHWHIYWDNHGDTGMSTSIDEGELIFPVPQKIPLPGSLMSYGYEGRVVLFVENPNTKIVIRWLACKEDTCIPGKKELQIKQDKRVAFQEEWKSIPKKCPFTWVHHSSVLSSVKATPKSWMAPYSELSETVAKQYMKNDVHYVQWKISNPKGRYLWKSETHSCIVHI